MSLFSMTIQSVESVQRNIEWTVFELGLFLAEGDRSTKVPQPMPIQKPLC